MFLGEEGEGTGDDEEGKRGKEVSGQDSSRRIDDIPDSRTDVALAIDFLDAIFWKLRQNIADQIN